MNILLISTNRNQFPVPVIPIGACMVAEAAERAGHEVRFLDMMFVKDPLKAIRGILSDWHPEVIGLSVRNIDNNDMHSPAFFLREIVSWIITIRSLSAAPVIVGGAAVSVMPEEMLRYTGATWAVTGDGEMVFPKLLEKLARGESPGDIPGVARIADNSFLMNQYSPEKTCSCRTPDYFRWVDTKAYLRRFATIPLQTKLGKLQIVYKIVSHKFTRISTNN